MTDTSQIGMRCGDWAIKMAIMSHHETDKYSSFLTLCTRTVFFCVYCGSSTSSLSKGNTCYMLRWIPRRRSAEVLELITIMFELTIEGFIFDTIFTFDYVIMCGYSEASLRIFKIPYAKTIRKLGNQITT